MRRRVARGTTTAGILPAAFLVAVLVGAPFAGTTTAPLIADRAATSTAPAAATPGSATAPSTAAAGYAATSADAASRSSGDADVDRSGSKTVGAAATDPSLSGTGISVPRDSMLTLVAVWLVLALVGLAVLYAARRSADRRRDQPPGSVSGSSSSP